MAAPGRTARGGLDSQRLKAFVTLLGSLRRRRPAAPGAVRRRRARLHRRLSRVLCIRLPGRSAGAKATPDAPPSAPAEAFSRARVVLHEKASPAGRARGWAAPESLAIRAPGEEVRPHVSRETWVKLGQPWPTPSL